MKSAVLRHYDEKYRGELARGVDADDRVRPTACPENRYEACVSDLVRRFGGGSLLEIGAGSGRLARSLAAAGLPFDRYVATELSGVRMEALRARLAGDPRFEVDRLDLDDPPELAAEFDAVVMVALVEHLFDPLRALCAVRRMLRPGGFVLVDTPNVAKATRRLKLLAGRFPSTASRDEGLTGYDGQPVDLHDEGHLHYFTFRSLERLLCERCGFGRVERVPYATPPRPFGRRGTHLLARALPGLFSEVCVVAYADG